MGRIRREESKEEYGGKEEREGEGEGGRDKGGREGRKERGGNKEGRYEGKKEGRRLKRASAEMVGKKATICELGLCWHPHFECTE